MLLVQCNHSCNALAFADCVCPALGHNPAVTGQHHPDCDFTDLGDTIKDCSCCPGDTHPGLTHDQNAMACPGINNQHTGVPCPVPDNCPTWISGTSNVAGSTTAGPCPGGHCALNVPGCQVCRPVVITLMPGSTNLIPAGG